MQTVMKANVVITDQQVHIHTLNLLQAIEPKLQIQVFASVEELVQSLGQNPNTGMQILVTESIQTIKQVFNCGYFMATVLLGSPGQAVVGTSVCCVSRMPHADELVNSIQTVYRIAEQFYKLQRDAEKMSQLAERERKIIELAVVGTPNKAIASKLGVSVKTVEKNRRKAYLKLNVNSAAEMASLVTFNRFCPFFQNGNFGAAGESIG